MANTKLRIRALKEWLYANGLPKKPYVKITEESKKQKLSSDLDLIFSPLSKKRELFTKGQKANLK